MTKVTIEIADEVFEEATCILESLGLNIEIATSIFLRRVVLEGGLPFTMTVKTKEANLIALFGQGDEDEREKDCEAKDATISSDTARYKKITKEMTQEVWKSFMIHLDDQTPIEVLSTDLARRTGMNWGSASIYLNFLLNLIKADQNFKTIKFKDVEFFMAKIRTNLGEATFRNAIKSLQISIPFWRSSQPGYFADKAEAYCKKYE